MWAVSVLCLSITMALCVAGTFSCKYDDNLFQRIGMFLLFLGCFPRVREAWTTESVTDYVWVAHLGLALFAVGTAFKVWKFRKRDMKKEPPPEFPSSQLRHVTGGTKK